MTPASALLVAVGAALFFALAEISLRNALRFTTPATASILAVAVQWLTFTLATAAAGKFSELNPSGVRWFMLSGAVNPVLFLTFFLIGVQRIGIARSSPIKGSGPIFAVIFAAGFLGERLLPLQYLGIAFVVGGILIISTEGLGGIRPGAKVSSSIQRSPTGGDPVKPSTRMLDFLFPLLAAVAGGTASVLFKVSLGKMPSPLLGAWIGASEGLLLLPLLAFLFPKEQRFRVRLPALPWLVLAGLTASVAFYGFILAIKLGQVSIVFTLAQTSPLYVLLLSALFLRQLERVTQRVVVGALLTVGGGVLVSLV
ncbi:MAG: DMT family transporter [Nitrospinota bacterium]